MSKFNSEQEELYWSKRYREEKTGWDIGYPSGPLKAYVDQLENKKLRILIPGAGNAYEAEYLFNNGFENITVLDISKNPLEDFAIRVPAFPRERLVNDDFFSHEERYDLILEQTFFCSFLPTKENRNSYAKKMSELLLTNGKLVGLWFDTPLQPDQENRPFGGSKEEYIGYLSPYFETKIFEKAHNSIQPRAGVELFGIFQKLN